MEGDARGTGLSPEGRFPFHAPFAADDTAFRRANGSANEARAQSRTRPATS